MPKTVKIKKTFKNFRFSDETLNTLREQSTKHKVNHTELVELSLKYIENNNSFKKYIENNRKVG